MPADICAGRRGSRTGKKDCGEMNRTNVKNIRHANGMTFSRAGAGKVQEM